jgi:cytochrome b561
VKDQSNTAKLSGMTIGLHWLLAIAMIGMLAFGCLEDMPKGEAKSALIWWHKGLGVAIRAFALWRLGWRLIEGFPVALSHAPAWQERIAGFTPLVLALGHAVYAGLGRDDVAGIERQY